MTNKKFLMHKMVVAMINDSRQSSDSLEAYNELNLSANEEAEFSAQYTMQAVKLIEGGQYMEALSLLEKAILHCQGDLSQRIEAQNHINHICGLGENLALENLSDVRIGQIYEYSLKRGNVGLYFHGCAALHYRKIGEKEKSEALFKKIKNVAPNLTILDQRSE